jgi:hypothetical protein
VLERYTYYLRLLGLTPNSTAVPPTLTADRAELTEDNWTDTYNALVGEYIVKVPTQAYNQLQLAQGSAPSQTSGASSQGQLYLITNEDTELNTNLPNARDERQQSNIYNTVAAGLAPVPSVELHLAYWGLGGHSNLVSGLSLSSVPKFMAELHQVYAAYSTDQASISGRTGGYQRRVDDWTLQANLAADELMAIGNQVLASLIAEQVAKHDYTTVQTQVQQAQAVQTFLQTKFTNEAFYDWMQGEIFGLYYQYYRFACDTARRAEQTVKQELMRPELDQTQFIQYNYWDSGHQGLVSGEKLFLDIKRLEMAYHDSNKREIEIIRHVSLRQLDPVALLTLRITGSCTVSVPEWLYDRDCPGLYMRRIKTVALSIPSVVGPYTGVNCTLTLQSSSLRTSSLLANGAYARTGQDDGRFTDYFGSTDVIVTSTGSNDSGMFETNLHEDRFLPFEGAGAISTWNLALPAQLRSFDYSTISDVILHIHYTARMAGDPLGAQATKELAQMLDTAGQSGQALMFCLRYEFPTEWSAFINGSGNFQVVLEKQYFPYIAQGAKTLTIDGLSLFAGNGDKVAVTTPLSASGIAAANTSLATPAANATLALPPDPSVLVRLQDQLVFMVLLYHFGQN